ncbi:RUS1 family protein C16orf58-like [Hondaea fermentalgiana]|uniref:RUS1 family protein C16orf58-like n=1 Tax=Hondaea fermentalgiana TaxID=2315210 RepID=A0A2R5G8E6_9STRA|nr:RUS1 family protein C16orf58-like [Hondaea fermentalgiana]|eukprot:GBG24753.1 RUS1 family protein C16orf58-like [Hondaea fermentalgiana]
MILAWIWSLFVPDGYPASVEDDYAWFQAFDSLQGLCSYLRGVLSTKAILAGLGVGADAADAMAATTQWVYRDGAGMLGGLLFAWVGGGRFDRNVKGWRLFADLAVDLALSLELLSPLMCAANDRTCFTALMCAANVLKAMCGIAAGATRVVITNHFARDGNTADVQAKEGSQETLVNLIGMASGLRLAQFVDAHAEWEWLPWMVFVALTAVHVLANYFAVRALHLRHLNSHRLSLLLLAFAFEEDKADMSPRAINALEPVVGSVFDPAYRVTIGVDPSNDASALEALFSHTCVALPARSSCSSPPGEIRIALGEDATPKDIVTAIAKAALGSAHSASAFVDRLEHLGWRLSHVYSTITMSFEVLAEEPNVVGSAAAADDEKKRRRKRKKSKKKKGSRDGKAVEDFCMEAGFTEDEVAAPSGSLVAQPQISTTRLGISTGIGIGIGTSIGTSIGTGTGIGACSTSSFSIPSNAIAKSSTVHVKFVAGASSRSDPSDFISISTSTNTSAHKHS